MSLGTCFDLLDSKFTEMAADYYGLMEANYKVLGKEMPRNKDAKTDVYQDKILRELDCSVIEYMHYSIEEQRKKDISAKGFSTYKEFDSSRGVFTEGAPAFNGSGIQLKSHIQICIRKTNCIKGFFLPRKEI